MQNNVQGRSLGTVTKKNRSQFTVQTLLQPYFAWSSQLHDCCVHDTLQTSRDASNLVESLGVVGTLLLFVKLGSSCRKSSHLATFLP